MHIWQFGVNIRNAWTYKCSRFWFKLPSQILFSHFNVKGVS